MRPPISMENVFPFCMIFLVLLSMKCACHCFHFPDAAHLRINWKTHLAFSQISFTVASTDVPALLITAKAPVPGTVRVLGGIRFSGTSRLPGTALTGILQADSPGNSYYLRSPSLAIRVRYPSISFFLRYSRRPLLLPTIFRSPLLE